MGTVKTGAQDPKYRLGTSEPRTPSTPQSLAQLREQALAEHREGPPGWCDYCTATRWPCTAYELATLLSVENVAAGLHAIAPNPVIKTEGYRRAATDLLEAIGASHD